MYHLLEELVTLYFVFICSEWFSVYTGIISLTTLSS
jgi:hypothetical protein